MTEFINTPPEPGNQDELLTANRDLQHKLKTTEDALAAHKAEMDQLIRERNEARKESSWSNHRLYDSMRRLNPVEENESLREFIREHFKREPPGVWGERPKDAFCENCEHCRRQIIELDTENEERAKRQWVCTLNPPIVVLNMDGLGMPGVGSAYPPVRAEWTCGKYFPRIEPPSPSKEKEA